MAAGAVEDGDEDLRRIDELNQLGDLLTRLGQAHLSKAGTVRGRLKWRHIGRAEGLTEAFSELHRIEQRRMAEARRKRGLS